MQGHVCRAATNRSERYYASFLFYSALHQYNRTLDNRSADHVLGLRGPVLAVDQRVWNDRAMGILPDARSQGPAQFQNHGDDLRGRTARRQFLLLFQHRLGKSFDLIAGLIDDTNKLVTD